MILDIFMVGHLWIKFSVVTKICHALKIYFVKFKHYCVPHAVSYSHTYLLSNWTLLHDKDSY